MKCSVLFERIISILSVLEAFLPSKVKVRALLPGNIVTKPELVKFDQTVASAWFAVAATRAVASAVVARALLRPKRNKDGVARPSHSFFWLFEHPLNRFFSAGRRERRG